MPIVFVHGVATRDVGTPYAVHWAALQRYLLDYIAPVISPDPTSVAILDGYWGDLGVKFAWNRDSRPLSPLLGQGAPRPPELAEQALVAAETAAVIKDIPEQTRETVADEEFVAAGPSPPLTTKLAPLRLSSLSRDRLSDLLASVAALTFADPREQAAAAAAADAVAHDDAVRARIEACRDQDAEVRLTTDMVRQQFDAVSAAEGALGGMGPGLWRDFKDRLGEATGRAVGVPGFVVTRALAEVRKPANDLVTLFLGDVFKYLQSRGDRTAPNTIPAAIMGKLKKARAEAPAGEPLVVVTHSMGGQVVYDLVTHFLPALPVAERPRIDFWCATASQVGLFEEMKMFLESSPAYSAATNKKVPFPDHNVLGGWWNVWDPGDFISFTAEPIFEGVDDEPYDSGMSVLRAHGGYLARPSFYRRFAEKLEDAKKHNWWRPDA